MTNDSDTNSPSRRFTSSRSKILFVAASVIWAAVMVDTGTSAWPVAMWITTALIPYSLHQHRTDSAEPDSTTGTPT